MLAIVAISFSCRISDGKEPRPSAAMAATTSDSTSASLIRRVKEADPVAWDVHDGHFPLNFGQVVRLLGGKMELGE